MSAARDPRSALTVDEDEFYERPELDDCVDDDWCDVECDACGGSGGGDDAALRCLICGGRGA